MDTPLDQEQVSQRELQLVIAGLAFDITTLAHSHPDPTQHAAWLWWQRRYTVYSVQDPAVYLLHLRQWHSSLQVIVHPPLPHHWTPYGAPRPVSPRASSPTFQRPQPFGSPQCHMGPSHTLAEETPLPCPLIFTMDMLPDALPPFPTALPIATAVPLPPLLTTCLLYPSPSPRDS